MNTKIKIALVVELCLLAGIGIIYFKYTNTLINADQQTSTKLSCQLDIEGKITLTHTVQNDNLKLKLVSAGKQLAITTPQNGRYQFKLKSDLPVTNSLYIVAWEKINNQTLEYSVMTIEGAECGSPINVDLEL